MPVFAKRQEGGVLVVALILLLMMTLLATTSMRSATLQGRISGSVAEQKMALSAAESSLREAERRLEAYSTLDEGAQNCTASAETHAHLCILNSTFGAQFFAYASFAGNDGGLDQWWLNDNFAIDFSGTDNFSSFTLQPRWNLAYVGFDPGHEVTNVEEAAYGVGPHFYVVSAAGKAGGGRINQVLQSVTIRRY
jgi:type IV pilus assembly protein PilX